MRATRKLYLSVTTGALWAGVMAATALGLPAPGALDPVFDADGKATAAPAGFNRAYGDISMALDAEDRVVVAGSLNDPATTGEDLFVGRYNADGSVDLTFGTNGFVTVDRGGGEYVGELGIDPLGRIVVAARSGHNGLVIRLSPDGTLDPTFGSEGIVESNFGQGSAAIVGLALDGEHVVLAVTFSDGLGPDASYFAAPVRLNPDGSPDVTFGDEGTGQPFRSAYASDVVIDDQKRTILGGSTSQSSPSDAVLVRYGPTGAIDPAFSQDGSIRIDFADRDDFLQQLEVDGRDRIVAAIYFTDSAPIGDDMGVARVLDTGALDRSFGGDGKTSVHFGTQSDVPLGMTIDRNDEVIVVGRTPQGGEENAPNDFGVARIRDDGALDKTFSGDGRIRTDFAGRDDWAFDAAIDSGGRIVVGGRATSVEDGARAPVLGLARYIGGPYGPDPSLSIGDASLREGDRGSKTIYLPVTLSSAPTSAVSVRVKGEFYASEGDLNRVDRVVHLEAGETTERVPVKVHGDLQRNEGNERFTFLLRDASGALIADGKAVLTIRDDRDPCDIVGTEGRDRLVGTRGVTCGLGGNDMINGGHNFDKILGGDGDDVIYGNAANDVLLGGAGRDRLYGGSGTDSFDGGGGSDRCVDAASYERRVSC